MTETFTKELQTAKQCTFDILDGFPAGYRFHGADLMKEVLRRTGEMHYPDTLLRYAREYRVKRRDIRNVDKAKSIYEMSE
jgi:hypothetical protein